MHPEGPDYQTPLPPRYVYIAVGTLLIAILIALIVVIATLGEETTISKVFLSFGFVAVAGGLALVIAGSGNHRRATAMLKSKALDLLASREATHESATHDDPTDEIKAIEAELLRVGATSEANEVAKARREGLPA